MEVIVTIASKLVDFTYLGDLQPTYKGYINGIYNNAFTAYHGHPRMLF